MTPTTKRELREAVEAATEWKFCWVAERVRELSVPGDCIRTADLPMLRALADVLEEVVK